ncbi:hypothetical protein UMM65_06680 [Aureibaculum sp. 2210JD6-5]|uniref:hypothetical protein n=1 Tax=Aureibaculum sp. 2210JD6-5 TaxID=3103957 RepID=UPI002AACC5D3|nr:hypothetical protein [Aureibaculum sp. 2210JD6-5]MDY7394919.1 hypothetical protein [Aureibaculum sp. 2210JD6-5]
MTKLYYFYAKWRKKDVSFFSNLGIDIEQGYYSFTIEEGDVYDKIIKYYFRKDLFNVVKPKEFSTFLARVDFTKEELNASRLYALTNFGAPTGFPLPKDSFMDKVYESYCKPCHIYKNQINPFQIATPKLSKKQVNFSLNWVFDAMFFKKEFFLEVLKPLGLNSINVILNKTGKVSEDIVQLDIPVAKSKLLIDGTAYDTEKACSACGIKKYSQQTLDIFPKFERDFDFLICKTQEFFGESDTQSAFKRVVISKKLCIILIKYNLIEFNSRNLIPMES